MEAYVAAKQRILANQGAGDTAVVGVDDNWSAQILTGLGSGGGRAVTPISASKAMSRGVYTLDGILYDALGERVVQVADLKRARSLPGRHNWQNAAAAYAAARAAGMPGKQAVRGLLSFPGLAHRMETVGQIGKVRFVNDSKATNADAARQALASYPSVYWIVGGRAKTDGIGGLADLFPRVTRAYLIGEAEAAFEATLAGRAECRRCGTLEAATAAAAHDARASGKEAVVLLSPACASFDQFPDFEARGDAFRAAVADLTTHQTHKGAA
jgi:UDP-N-acetylmuramoylalanine--D-glutamate ligase